MNKEIKDKIKAHEEILKRLEIKKDLLESEIQQSKIMEVNIWFIDGGYTCDYYLEIIEGIREAASIQGTLNTGADLTKMKGYIQYLRDKCI